MRSLGLISIALLVLSAGQGWPDPPMTSKPVTSKDVPPPGPAQTRLWGEAIFRALMLRSWDDQLPSSDALRMLVAVQRGDKLSPGVGWYDPSQCRHDWAWLAARYDANGDGRITRKEFTGDAEWFKRMDRDGNGVITA